MPMLNLLLPNASMYILHIVLLSPRQVEFIKQSRSSLVGGFLILVSLGVIGLTINGSEL